MFFYSLHSEEPTQCPGGSPQHLSPTNLVTTVHVEVPPDVHCPLCGALQGSQLPVTLPYITCSPSMGSQLEGSGVRQDGSQDWQLAGQGNHFRHHTGLSPSQIFSVTGPYEFCGIPKGGTGD